MRTYSESAASPCLADDRTDVTVLVRGQADGTFDTPAAADWASAIGQANPLAPFCVPGDRMRMSKYLPELVGVTGSEPATPRLYGAIFPVAEGRPIPRGRGRVRGRRRRRKSPHRSHLRNAACYLSGAPAIPWPQRAGPLQHDLPTYLAGVRRRVTGHFPSLRPSRSSSGVRLLP